MTYMFEIRHPGVQEGEAAEKELLRLKGVCDSSLLFLLLIWDWNWNWNWIWI